MQACPYDGCRVGELPTKVFDLHLMFHRQERGANLRLTQCPYDARHWIPMDELSLHKETCNHRHLVNEFVTAVPTTVTPAVAVAPAIINSQPPVKTRCVSGDSGVSTLSEHEITGETTLACEANFPFDNVFNGHMETFMGPEMEAAAAAASINYDGINMTMSGIDNAGAKMNTVPLEPHKKIRAVLSSKFSTGIDKVNSPESGNNLGINPVDMMSMLLELESCVKERPLQPTLFEAMGSTTRTTIDNTMTGRELDVLLDFGENNFNSDSAYGSPRDQEMDNYMQNNNLLD